MPDTTSTSHYRPGQLLRPVSQLKKSKYTTGLLTTSGFIQQHNSSWQVVGAASAGSIGDPAVDAEVEELFNCQDKERSSDLGEGTISYKSDRDQVQSEELGADTLSIPEQYFDYSSYFRYAGWAGCASLQQDVIAATTSTLPPVETSQAVSGIPAFAETGFKKNALLTTHTPVDRTRLTTVAASGVAIKKVKGWYHPDENAWLLLLFKKVKAMAETGRKIKSPGPSAITPLFNVFFEGRVLQDEHGSDLPPREAREELSIKGKITKMHTEIWKVRSVARKLLEDSHGGEVYVPGITEEELRQFQVDGTVQPELH